jgi:hypothetical protein
MRTSTVIAGVKDKAIDNSFVLVLVSGTCAKLLCARDEEGGRPGLPPHGYQRRVAIGGTRYWIARTVHLARQNWSVRWCNAP